MTTCWEGFYVHTSSSSQLAPATTRDVSILALCMCCNRGVEGSSYVICRGREVEMSAIGAPGGETTGQGQQKNCAPAALVNCKAQSNTKTSMLLGKTAEIALVLAGMAQMRAGQPPGIQEHELLTEAFRSLSSFLECVDVAPRQLLSKKFEETLAQELGLKDLISSSTDKQQEYGKHSSIAQADTEEKTSTVACSLLVPGMPAAAAAEEAEEDANCRRSSSTAGPAATSAVETDNSLSLSESCMVPYAGSDEELPSSFGWSWRGPPNMATPLSLSSQQCKEEDARVMAYRRQLWQAVQEYVSHQMSVYLQNLSPSTSSYNNELASTGYAYVTVSMACEMCPERIVTSDTATVLVCDSCELAFHVKCLEKFNARGLLEGEDYWRCPKCVVRHGGRPQPPVYGRMPPRQQVRLSIADTV